MSQFTEILAFNTNILFWVALIGAAGVIGAMMALKPDRFFGQYRQIHPALLIGGYAVSACAAVALMGSVPMGEQVMDYKIISPSHGELDVICFMDNAVHDRTGKTSKFVESLTLVKSSSGETIHAIRLNLNCHAGKGKVRRKYLPKAQWDM